ncbi:MAG: thioredoxin domain-containing protein [Chitinophagaceae bacterium]|nr:thioredoxin domain-containing protein [Chitinophagaceae bacterium]
MALKAKEVEIIPTRDVFVGDIKAPVTLTEYGDYESEACAKANEVVDKLLTAYAGKMRFNFRHFPLTKIHQHAMKAAEASLGAAQEGKFWEMHNTLFAHRRRLGAISLREYAKDVGVINKKFLENLVNCTYGWSVKSDLLEGLDKGVRDVPAFFINGELFTGKPTYDNLSKGIEAALSQGKKKKPANGRTQKAAATKV